MSAIQMMEKHMEFKRLQQEYLNLCIGARKREPDAAEKRLNVSQQMKLIAESFKIR